MIDTSRKIEEYLALPYTDWVRMDVDEGGYYAGVVELPGCLADGESREEALERLQDAKRSWLASAIDHGDPIPVPLEAQVYSGRILVRAPKSLHRDLAQRAALEGVSLNQLCVSFLSRALERTVVVHPRAARSDILGESEASGHSSASASNIQRFLLSFANNAWSLPEQSLSNVFEVMRRELEEQTSQGHQVIRSGARHGNETNPDDGQRK